MTAPMTDERLAWLRKLTEELDACGGANRELAADLAVAKHELDAANRQCAAMRVLLEKTPFFARHDKSCHLLIASGHAGPPRCDCDFDDWNSERRLVLSGTAGRGFVPVEVADKLARLLRDWMGDQPFPDEEGPSPFEQNVCATLSAYEAAKGGE